MINRTWSGRAAPERRDAYPTHFRRHALPALRCLRGFGSAVLLAREALVRVQFQVPGRWDPIEAIRRFAGEDPQRAVVESGAVAMPIGFGDRVRHVSLFEDAA